jgi:hypothetical protein
MGVEAVVIVVSVFVAISLESWWAEQELRRDLVEELRSVDQEMVINDSLVVYQIDLMSRISEGSRILAEAIRDGDGAAFVEVPDTVAWLAMGAGPTLDPSMGALTALSVSGRLPAIRDLRLRTDLMGLTGLFEDAVEEQDVARMLNEEQLRPMVQREVDAGPVGEVGLKFWALVRVPGQPLESTTTMAVPASLEVLNSISRRREYLTVSINEMHGLRETFAEIRQRIAAEIAG